MLKAKDKADAAAAERKLKISEMKNELAVKLKEKNVIIRELKKSKPSKRSVASSKPKPRLKSSSVSKSKSSKSKTVKPKTVKPKMVKPAPTKAKSAKTKLTVTKSKDKSGAGKKRDNLKKIEGIGPKIEKLLIADGIHSFAKLAKANQKRLEKILANAGPRFQMHSPATWPQQAELANAGKWKELQVLQDRLDGGRANSKKGASAKSRKKIENSKSGKAAGSKTRSSKVKTKRESSNVDRELRKDDLTRIEGIGPKIAKLLVADGIRTFENLAAAPKKRLEQILDNAGPRFNVHVPDTWPRQSSLAAAGKWKELDKLQEELDAGRPD